MIKDLNKVKQNGKRVLISLLKRHFDPRKTQATLERMARKGTPMMESNNNYWAKKVSKFLQLKGDTKDLDFKKFAQMDYKELYQEAVGDLNTSRAKMAFR